MDSIELSLQTGVRTISDLTGELVEFCAERGDGLANVFVPHATAGLALIEIGAGSDDDLIETIARLLPRGNRYRHNHGSPGHGADHVLPAFFPPSLSIPVINCRPTLGTWQSLVLIDTNADNPQRTVRMSFLGG